MATDTEIQIDSDIEEMLKEITDKKEATKKDKLYKLILFNDDEHDVLEVSMQLIKALQCTAEKATQIMFEAHKTGQAVALVGTKEKVQKAARVLEEIDLKIDIVEA